LLRGRWLPADTCGPYSPRLKNGLNQKSLIRAAAHQNDGTHLNQIAFIEESVLAGRFSANPCPRTPGLVFASRVKSDVYPT
jgi:hypothetical protein